jgi:hypothetical protein
VIGREPPPNRRTGSQAAGEVADGFVSTTILLAVALFFVGVTSSFLYRPARMLLLLAATRNR